MNRLKIAVILVAAFATGSFLSPASAEYPDRPLKIIVAWPPGGVTDTVARIVGEQLAQAIKQPVVIENRAGANGILGTEVAAKLPTDGYGLQAVTAETHAINPFVYKSLAYSVSDNFEPIAMLARASFVLATKADLAANNVQELVALAKSAPGKLSAASYGIGSTSHIALASFEKATGTNFLHVPYRGVSPAVNALLTGEVDIAFVTPHIVVELRKTGKVKILGVAASRRMNMIGDVPTLAEQGVAGFEAGNWYGIVGPHGLPEVAKKRLAAELKKIVASQFFTDRISALGVEVEYRDAAQFTDFLRSEALRWGEIIKERKIELDR